MRTSGVCFVFAAETEDEVHDGLAEEIVFGLAAGLEDGEAGHAEFFKFAGFGQEAIALGVEDGAHVSLGDGGDGAQNGLFAAAGAGAVAGDQRIVSGADHQHISQRRGLGVGGVGRVEEAEVLLRSVGQQVEEVSAGHVFGVDLFGLGDHA